VFNADEAKKAALKDFEECRNSAAYHSQLKSECYLKAKNAVARGENGVALYYSQIANLHKSKIDQYNHKAANCIMEVHSLRQNNPDMLDLHYLHLAEAVQCLDLFLDEHITNLKSASSNNKNLFVITGRGLHSAGGIPTVKLRVKQHLAARGLR
jgi:DNA-nicking Smr family endonuclease